MDANLAGLSDTLREMPAETSGRPFSIAQRTRQNLPRSVSSTLRGAP